MGSLLEAALPYLPASVGTLLLLLIAPLVGEVGRRRIALVFGLAAIGMIVVAVQRGGTTAHLDVFNPYDAAIRTRQVQTDMGIGRCRAPDHIDPTARAETLTIAQFQTLAASLTK